MSKIEEKVIDTIRLRAKVGAFKYGTTMERDDLHLSEWLRHLQEELLDAAIYVQKLIDTQNELTKEVAQLAIESVERQKVLAMLEAEVEALRSLSRHQEGDGTEKTKA